MSNKYPDIQTFNVNNITRFRFQGGLIAKRLLAFPSTVNTTNIAVTLAAPLEAPVVTFDVTINNYYTFVDYEWSSNIDKMNKVLLSFGNGPRDLLIPAGLTSSNESFISAQVRVTWPIDYSNHYDRECLFYFSHSFGRYKFLYKLPLY